VVWARFTPLHIIHDGVGPAQPPIQWVTRALSLGAKQPGREADYCFPTSVEVKNTWIYTSTPPYVFITGRTLSFTFTSLNIIQQTCLYYVDITGEEHSLLCEPYNHVCTTDFCMLKV
jgi:hypothetical protein